MHYGLTTANKNVYAMVGFSVGIKSNFLISFGVVGRNAAGS